MKPVALVTGIVTPYRREPFRLLDEAENVEVLAHSELGERAVVRQLLSGRYRAVIGGLIGRVAVPGSYLAARARGVPFVLWASLWGHPRTPSHALSFLPMVWIYRHADAVATYGPHVSAYVARYRRDRATIFEAPQASVLGELAEPPPRRYGFHLVFVGRRVHEKGLDVLVEAWQRADLGSDAKLTLAGAGPVRIDLPDVRDSGMLTRDELPALYASADAVVLPSVRTATFREPWGLVVNEAMEQATPVIVSDEVGAAAGGLVVDGRNGFVVPAGDPDALAARIRVLAMNRELRERLGRAAREDVKAFSEAAWVAGMQRALRAVGVGAPC